MPQLQDTRAALKSASRRELAESRRRLKKLERDLSYKLCSRVIEPHMAEAVEEFLNELVAIIKSTPEIY